MHWSPDVLTALRGARRYDPLEQSRQAQRTTPVRTVRWAARTEHSRPDYGCVDWFVYEEQPPEQESA